MPIASIQLPDGRTADIEIPEGMGEAEVQAQLQTMFEQGAFDQVPQAPAQEPVQPAAPQMPADVPTPGAGVPAFPTAPAEAPQEPSTREQISQAILATPGGAAASEIAAGANQAVIDLVDFLGPDQINNILQLAGSEARVPTLGETELAQQAGAGGFVEGRPGRALRAAGGVVPAALGGGAVLRELAARAPAVTPSLQTFGAGLTQQLARGTTAAGDILTGAGAAAGTELAEGTGAVGEIAGGIAGALTAGGIKAAITGTPGMIRSIFSSAVKEAGTDEGAAKLLAEQMVREGVSPDEVAQRLRQLGPDAIPADALSTFQRILRTASNEIPRIEGQARQLFQGRQVAQAQRLTQAFDEVGGTIGVNADDAIRALSERFKPRIDELYSTARQKAVRLSPKVRSILEGKGLGRDARRAAEKILQTRRTLGDKISNIDIIDATKQKLDDKIAVAIRQGERGLVRELVRVKNALVEEADKAIPEYQQARSLFAGKAQMESAAEMGEQFFKLKPKELEGLVKSMGDAERRMFKLGAKNAILDKMEDIQTNADLVKRLFGKRGDIRKLSAVFDDEAALKRFSGVLERESKFIMTRRAAEANSTTVKQATDSVALREAFEGIADASTSPTGLVGLSRRIFGGLAKKRNSEEFIKALTDAGDLLLEKGADPEKVASLLRRGNKDAIERAIRSAIKKPPTGRGVVPAAVGIETALEGE